MIHTIGHSNHPLERFLALLRQHAIEAVADVRSMPYSRFNPQFGREKLREALAGAGIQYVFLGQELGVRTHDPAYYDADGRVSYARLAAADHFHRGLQRLRAGMESYRITLMCAEREPLECHRTILIARELERSGSSVKHILADGSLEEHAHAMERLVTSLKLQTDDLFAAPGAVLERAYDQQAARIAYVDPDMRAR